MGGDRVYLTKRIGVQRSILAVQYALFLSRHCENIRRSDARSIEKAKAPFRAGVSGTDTHLSDLKDTRHMSKGGKNGY